MATIRDKARDLLKPIPDEVQSKRDASEFSRLTNGMTHTKLQTEWENTKKTSTLRTVCIDFVVWYAGQMGIDMMSLIPAKVPWGANSSLPREGRTHATTRPRAGGRSRGGIRGSGWTSPSLRTTRSLKFSIDQRVGVDMSTSLDPRPRVPRRSIPANRVRHDCSGDVAACCNGFTTPAHSRCPPDPILAKDTGGRLVKHARYYWLLLAESHLTRRLFGSMLRRTWALPIPTG
jgi:hypothetical protein